MDKPLRLKEPFQTETSFFPDPFLPLCPLTGATAPIFPNMKSTQPSILPTPTSTRSHGLLMPTRKRSLSLFHPLLPPSSSPLGYGNL